MKILALCHTCRHQHKIEFDPRAGPGSAFSDWTTKHAEGHRTEFRWPERTRKQAKRHLRKPDYLHYLHNADVKTSYAASASPTLTLASLAASSSLLAGRESTAIDNGASNKYLDYHLAGHYRTGASNLQAGRIRTAVVGAKDDTPSWPDVFDGTDSVETVTTADMYNSVCRLVSEIVTDATQRTWPFGPVALAGLWGGAIPDQFIVFVSHDAQTSTNVWSATEGDHSVRLTGLFLTVT